MLLSNKMSHSRSANAKFWSITVITIVGSAAGAAALVPVMGEYASRESSRLVVLGNQASGAEAETDYRLATYLNRRNTEAYVKLAQLQLDSGRPQEALRTLGSAGEGSEVVRARIRLLMELGSTTVAATAGQSLVREGAPDEDVVLAGLSLAVAGREAEVAALAPRVTAPEAAGRIKRIQAGNLALAGELYASGLPISSSTILLQLPASYERNLLLGRIYLTRNLADDLESAAGYLRTATVVHPAGVEAHELLAKVYVAQEKTQLATEQRGLIEKLRTGRP